MDRQFSISFKHVVPWILGSAQIRLRLGNGDKPSSQIFTNEIVPELGLRGAASDHTTTIANDAIIPDLWS